MKLLSCLALSLFAATAAHAGTILDWQTKTPTCVKAQRQIQRDRRQSQWNGLGITSGLSRDICDLDVTFAKASDMLAFVDARIAEGKDPTVEKVLGVRGHDFGVQLILSVIGEIRPLAATQLAGDDSDGELPRPATERQLMQVQDAFTRVYMGIPSIKMNSAGITIAQGGPALMVGFETPAGLHNYIAAAIARGESPAPVVGRAGGVLVSAPVDMSIIGPIGPIGAGSISH
jgi:hypothetical protein